MSPLTRGASDSLSISRVGRDRTSAAFDARRTVGRRGEDLARRYFLQKGYEVLGQNVRLGGVEIDLIVRWSQEIIFVEVKSRSTDYFGRPEEAVTRAKIRRIERGMAVYSHRHPEVQSVRFDVVAVTFSSANSRPRLKHFQSVGEGTLVFL